MLQNKKWHLLSRSVPKAPTLRVFALKRDTLDRTLRSSSTLETGTLHRRPNLSQPSLYHLCNTAVPRTYCSSSRVHSSIYKSRSTGPSRVPFLRLEDNLRVGRRVGGRRMPAQMSHPSGVSYLVLGLRKPSLLNRSPAVRFPYQHRRKSAFWSKLLPCQYIPPSPRPLLPHLLLHTQAHKCARANTHTTQTSTMTCERGSAVKVQCNPGHVGRCMKCPLCGQIVRCRPCAAPC